MAPAQLALLKSELTSDPAGLGYAATVATGDVTGTLAMLADRTKGGTLPQPIPSSQLLIWGASRGVLPAIQAGASGANAAIASACQAIVFMLQGGAMSLDIGNPIIAGHGQTPGLLDALTAANILPATGAGSKADLIAFGSVPASRADAVLGYGVIPSLADVSDALRS